MARRTITRSGRRLSEAQLDELAARAEAGFDLNNWQPRRGRPRLDATSIEHAPRIAVRVPESLHRKVTARANAEGRSVSEVVRELLARYASR
jgi:predicted DNA binding CopG/RHH family protein